MGRQQTVAAAVLVLVLAGGAVLAGCGPKAEKVNGVQPATLVAVPGSTLHRVVLTPEAVSRLAVATTPVLRATGSGGLLRIPETALVYDPEGRPWTYTVPAPRTYLRVAVVVDRTENGQVLLRSGPPAGTPVVDVAAPELLGAEYGVGEE
ncbi:hypothetical protein [Streptacidiphilus carbonis]|jgi:hypothetical protein|uniref:hypothetical protein n=1 Tax=Streptacidiphilus carbonis TaxID=105422 RepID=UPI0005A63BE2|nr:hypothetical protein [Streptacidiphilus carbonis]